MIDKPGKVRLNNEDVDVVDIYFGKNKTYRATIVLPGFSATPESLKNLILSVAESGRRVISAYAPHGIKSGRKISDLPEAEARKAELLLRLIEIKGLNKVNIIGHSEASIYATAVTILIPEKIENLILISPAGLIGKDNIFSLLRRVIEDEKERARQRGTFKKLRYPSPISVTIQSILSDPLASMKEALAIARSDITSALSKVRQLGVGVSIVHTVDDRFFPMERMQEIVTPEMVDGFYSVRGTHNALYFYEPFGRIALVALVALERKRDKNRSR